MVPVTSDRPDPAPGQEREQDPGEDTQPYRVSPPPPLASSARCRTPLAVGRGAGRAGSRSRRAGGRPGRARRGARRRHGGPVRRHPGATRGAGRGRRRLGPVAADRAARLQRRRRRGRRDLAGRHAVLPGPHRRGARPGRALPRPDDAPLRDRGAADRAVPRPLQPRPPMGGRRDHGDPLLPLLGAGDRRGHRVRVALPGGAGLPRRLQGLRRHPRRRGPAAAATGADAGEGQRPGLARGRRRGGASRRRSRSSPRPSGRSGRCATAS